MGKTAIVVGATGLIGKNIISFLDKADHIEKIISITRREVKYPSPKIENRIVDFDSIEEFKDRLIGDFLFSCLGTTKKQAGSINAQRKVDLDYQLRIARLALENGVENYLLVSSSGADSKSSNPYLKMKGELEDQIKKLEFKSISIFRPSLLMGQRNEFRFGEKLGGYLLPLICSIPGLKKYRPIKGGEVAAKMVDVSRNPGTGIQKYVLDEIFLN